MPQIFSLPEREPLRFVMCGEVIFCDPSAGRLQVGSTECWVAPAVALRDVPAGTPVTISGYVEGIGPRRIVTALSVDGQADGPLSPALAQS